MSDPSTLAIEAVDVRKSFDRGVVRALDGLTLQIASGEYVALTGPSGCGKSTFMHLLAALDTPDSGTLRVAGEDVTQLEHPNRFRRHKVGLVFQMHNLLPHLDALGNIGIAMIGSDMSLHAQRKRSQELLELVDLAGLGHRRPPELSGGERQRIALARALANRPQLVLADEPTGSLDSAARGLVLDLMERLRVQEGATILVVTHDEAAARAADRIVHLRDGRVVDA